MHLSFKLNSMLVLFLCIASQNLIPNADSKIKRYYFPFCFLCPIPLLYLALNCWGSSWQKKKTISNKSYQFFHSELTNVTNWHNGWPKVLDMALSKLLELHESILHWLLLTRHEPWMELTGHCLHVLCQGLLTMVSY